jgi:hypothetical protein
MAMVMIAGSVSDAEFFGNLGFKVVDVDGRLVLLDESLGLGLVFLSWFDSPLGIELLDARIPVLLNVPSKAPLLLSFLESQGSFAVGQWMFAGDETQGYNLTFGVQLSRGDLTTEVISATLELLKNAHSLGGQALEEMVNNPEDFSDVVGIKWVEGVSLQTPDSP